MSKCKKVKNPCKICLGPVTQKTGLQCQGACESWVHYACLNYTPGKIKDIKAGIIRVTCPCPDCKSTLPKEFRTDEPFSCSNLKCPANYPPKCENAACPINDEGPDKMNQTSIFKAPCPLSNCGTDCKKYSHPNLPDVPVSPRTEPCSPQHYTAAMQPPPLIPPPQIPRPPQMPRSPPMPPPNQDACIRPICASGCSSSNDISGDFRAYPTDGIPSFGVLEQMCNTVGQLTNQINCLMNNMKKVVQDRDGGEGSNRKEVHSQNCPQKANKSICPQPCYCPGNPARRK